MFTPQYFSPQYFDPVWFAPGDETGVPEEELRQDYRGGSGRMLPARDPFADGEDLVRIVQEKWEAIERADRRDAERARARAQEAAGDGHAPGQSDDGGQAAEASAARQSGAAASTAAIAAGIQSGIPGENQGGTQRDSEEEELLALLIAL